MYWSLDRVNKLINSVVVEKNLYVQCCTNVGYNIIGTFS